MEKEETKKKGEKRTVHCCACLAAGLREKQRHPDGHEIVHLSLLRG